MDLSRITRVGPWGGFTAYAACAAVLSLAGCDFDQSIPRQSPDLQETSSAVTGPVDAGTYCGDGWCDAVGDPDYNKPVKHPYRASAEVLWRDDAIYDLIVSTNHNIEPAKSGLGSAIFLHVARDDLTATEGCIAFRKNDLLEILKDVGPKTMIRIEMV